MLMMNNWKLKSDMIWFLVIWLCFQICVCAFCVFTICCLYLCYLLGVFFLDHSSCPDFFLPLLTSRGDQTGIQAQVKTLEGKFWILCLRYQRALPPSPSRRRSSGRCTGRCPHCWTRPSQTPAPDGLRN